jgi:hypothetical protein
LVAAAALVAEASEAEAHSEVLVADPLAVAVPGVAGKKTNLKDARTLNFSFSQLHLFISSPTPLLSPWQK